MFLTLSKAQEKEMKQQQKALADGLEQDRVNLEKEKDVLAKEKRKIAKENKLKDDKLDKVVFSNFRKCFWLLLSKIFALNNLKYFRSLVA